MWNGALEAGENLGRLAREWTAVAEVLRKPCKCDWSLKLSSFQLFGFGPEAFASMVCFCSLLFKFEKMESVLQNPFLSTSALCWVVPKVTAQFEECCQDQMDGTGCQRSAQCVSLDLSKEEQGWL